MSKPYTKSILAIMVIVKVNVLAATFYVMTNGNDANTGRSVSQAWATLAKTRSQSFSPGDSILLESGKLFNGYFANLRGTASSRIVISTTDTSIAIVNSGTNPGFSAYNAAGITIKNIKFMGQNTGVGKDSHAGVMFYTDTAGNRKLRGITLSHVEVTGYSGVGIHIQGNNGFSGFGDVTIDHCSSHDNLLGGIRIQGYYLSNGRGENFTNYANENIYIGYSEVRNNSGVHGWYEPSGNGILVANALGGTVEYCTAANNGYMDSNVTAGGPGAIWTFGSRNVCIQYSCAVGNRTGKNADGGGFDLDAECSSCTLQYNYSSNNDGAGYLLWNYFWNQQHTNNVVRYNVSENDGRKNGFGGIIVGNTATYQCQIYNNSIYLTPPQSGTPTGIKIEGWFKKGLIANNIIYTTGGLPTLQVLETYKADSLTLQGNCYFSLGNQKSIKLDSYTLSLSDLQSIWGFEHLRYLDKSSPTTGVDVNPQFLSAGMAGVNVTATVLHTLDNYHLASTSPCIDKGVQLGVLYSITVGGHDFNGLPIGSSPDMGSCEYQASSASRMISRMGKNSQTQDRPGLRSPLGKERLSMDKPSFSVAGRKTAQLNPPHTVILRK